METKVLLKRFLLASLLFSLAGCAPSEPRLPDLPKQSDRWIQKVLVNQDSEVEYIGKTKNFLITTITQVNQIEANRSIEIGDQIGGLTIGAIKCSFFWRDATYGREKYMWRGKWGCMAGRNRYEIENAILKNGEKRFDYVNISPVSLD